MYENLSVKLYFFGDSICVGQHISVHKTWVHKLSALLEKDFPSLTTINASVNGNTTRLALERMHYDVLSHKPDILYIQYGINDCNIWDSDNGCSRVSLSAYIANINEIIERAFARGVKKIILNTNHPLSGNKTFLTNKKNHIEKQNVLYYKELKQFQAKNKKIKFLDIRAHIESLNIDSRSYLLEDGIHLNEKGHNIYLEYIYPFIKRVLLESQL